MGAKQVIAATFYVQMAPEPGPQGNRGMLPYPAGVYADGTTYTATANVAPYVLLSETYYVMNKVGIWLGTFTKKTPAQDYAVNGVNAMWIPFETFKAIYVELLMARLGIIGKAVFYDEFMFSQYGTDASGNQIETVDGYKGFADGSFKPNLLLNFKTGEFKAKKCTLEGSIRKGLSIHETGSNSNLVLTDKNNYFVNISSENILALIFLSTGRKLLGAELTIYHCGSGYVRLLFFVTNAKMFLFKGKFYNEIRLTTLGAMAKLIYCPINETVCDPDIGGAAFIIENYSDFEVHTDGTTLINIT